MKTIKLFYIITFILAELGINLQAQTKLTGTVVDKNDHSLIGVNVDFNKITLI